MKAIAPFLATILLCSPAQAVNNFGGIAHVYRDKGVTYVELTTPEQGKIVGLIPKTSAEQFPDILFANGKLIEMSGAVQDQGQSRVIVLTRRSQLSVG